MAVHRNELKELWATWRDTNLVAPDGPGALDHEQMKHQKLASAALFVTKGDDSALTVEQVSELAAQREATLEADKARLMQYGRELEQGLEQLGIQPGWSCFASPQSSQIPS